MVGFMAHIQRYSSMHNTLFRHRPPKQLSIDEHEDQSVCFDLFLNQCDLAPRLCSETRSTIRCDKSVCQPYGDG
jgi:hypothetical protein